MIEHVYRRAADARGVDAVIVATDDTRIAAAVEAFGGIARMTQTAHRTGTDRIAEIARELPCDIVVNVQGDLPLVDPGMIEQVVDALRNDSAVGMSTVCRAMADPEEYTNPHVVKVVVDRRGNALYFSRAPIPYRRGSEGPPEDGPSEGGAPVVSGVSPAAGIAGSRRHIGMYGYRRAFLLEFAALPPTPLEQSESLEQLRALEHGFTIRVVETQYESIEVDTPEDLERVRRILRSRGAGVRATDARVAAPARA